MTSQVVALFLFSYERFENTLKHLFYYTNSLILSGPCTYFGSTRSFYSSANAGSLLCASRSVPQIVRGATLMVLASWWWVMEGKKGWILQHQHTPWNHPLFSNQSYLLYLLEFTPSWHGSKETHRLTGGLCRGKKIVLWQASWSPVHIPVHIPPLDAVHDQSAQLHHQ